LYCKAKGKGKAKRKGPVMLGKTLSRAEALKVIQGHGWTGHAQTATLNGELVNAGTSFDEMLGIKENYSTRAVFEWLGY
jgi:hypothetical protein